METLCQKFNRTFNKRIDMDTKIFFTSLSSVEILSFLLDVERDYGIDLDREHLIGDSELTIRKIEKCIKNLKTG